MSNLETMVHKSKRRALIEGPFFVVFSVVGAIYNATEGYVWGATLFAFAAGIVAGTALMSAQWLRTHYPNEWKKP